MTTNDERAGEYPYTRGIYPDMYRGRLWTMRQYAGYGTARETNRRLKRLLAHGQTGLSLAFDLPTQLGLDPDDPLAAGEVGRTGVSVASIDDLEAVLRGIPLESASLSMTINATAPALFAMAIALGERARLPASALRGTVQNDVLKEYAARNLYVLPPEPSFRMAVDVIEFGCRHMPKWHPISVSGYHMREAGADAGQEIGFALANGLAYVEATMRRGLSVDEIAPRLSFFFASDIDLFEEVAKFRAARRLWAMLMRERFAARAPESWRLKFHAQTSGSTLANVQIDNNVVRVALQTLAAALGGAQSIHANAKDEALRLPTARSAALALRTQQIVALESGVADRIDPLGGSYEVEALTDRLEFEARLWIGEIERQGGALSAVTTGYVQERIREAAYRAFQAKQDGSKPVVGVNCHVDREPVAAAAGRSKARAWADEEARAVEAVRKRRLQRSEQDAAEAASRVRRAARRGENVVPEMLSAVKSGCTVGELYGALRDEFGTYREPDVREEESAWNEWTAAGLRY